jgi:CubicO group peptidase (beta-lactamase class C family)
MTRKPASRLLQRALALAMLAMVTVALAKTQAPYLTRLVTEGWPAAEWPIKGSWKTIEGAAPAGVPVEPTMHAFNPAGRRLFAESGGKAFLVWQGGRLRFEHYRRNYAANTLFNSYSMAKSLIGALVIKAVDDGLVHDLADPVGSYLPELGDARFRAIPIADFLTMQSGLDLEDNDSKEAFRANPFGPLAQLHMEGLASVSDRLVVDEPRKRQFSYQNVNTAILGTLLESVYGQPLEKILSRQIWMPAGASTAYWRSTSPEGSVSAYCCIYATARDWIRIGIFLIHNGTEGRPFLRSGLWRAFMGQELSDETVRRGFYGYHIRHDVFDRNGEALQGRFSYMLGTGGQTTWLMPERDLVIVRFGERMQRLHSTGYAAWNTIQPPRHDSSSSREPVGMVRFPGFPLCVAPRDGAAFPQPWRPLLPAGSGPG